MKKRIWFLATVTFLFSTIVHAEIVLPNIFTDNMVLQRNSEVHIWGWGDLNEEVTIVTSWDDKEYKVTTLLTTKWNLQVSTPDAGGPFTVHVKGKSNEIILKNVLIGEVWLCSGQSNMEWSANLGIDNAAEEIKNANYPNIRFFSVTKRTSETKQDNIIGSWEECTPESMQDFTAIGYFFARKLKEDLDIPIGIIDTGWGATSAEVWTPESVFEESTYLGEQAKKIGENKWAPVKPSILYNAMIYPLQQFKIAGALWYQGESNTANNESYEELFSKMITSWRKNWGYDFPFYYVQIAPYTYGKPEQGVLVRDAQRRALKIENTAMVVVSDICTVDDIHPTNKQDVGLRLANIALKEQYKSLQAEVYGPLFKEINILGSKVEVSFDHSEGLNFQGKKGTHFEVAGTDGNYYVAKAKIKDEKVILSAKEVKEPKKVRFAWSNTALPNLFNGAGLPASSFISN
ncbi:sialate O-acetylesterase [Maribacter algarum]|uniref:Sialate O-acetylesterase n=1 Tax=Maribacter algarum (ex Zhang et al. 2020) TaxID=2578118 RepID=A0A5S3PHT3_9FLAO|nr:sialate O-acetylesterase [Maribacter algarum]TMM53828.1 sialate O-acetylesterase [Maribacter algarum]